MTTTRQYILLFFDVTIDDIRSELDRVSNTRPRETKRNVMLADSLMDHAVFATIPREFTVVSKHPTSTNLLCWHCDAFFKTVPRFIALEYTVSKWIIDGNFCSWPCAAAYLAEHYTDPRLYALRQNLASVRSTFDGTKVRDIPPAPPRIELEIFRGAGGMSRADFDARITAIMNGLD